MKNVTLLVLTLHSPVVIHYAVVLSRTSTSTILQYIGRSETGCSFNHRRGVTNYTVYPTTCDRALCFVEQRKIRRPRCRQIDTQVYLVKHLIDSQKAAWHLTFELCHRHSQECPLLALAYGRTLLYNLACS